MKAEGAATYYPSGASVLQAVPLVVAGTAMAGAVVGAVHGAALVRVLLARERP